MSEEKKRAISVETMEGEPMTEAELQAWMERYVALVVDEYRNQQKKEGNT